MFSRSPGNVRRPGPPRAVPRPNSAVSPQTASFVFSTYHPVPSGRSPFPVSFTRASFTSPPLPRVRPRPALPAQLRRRRPRRSRRARPSRARGRGGRRASRGGRRTAAEEPLGVGLDEHLLRPLGRGAPDREAAVAVVVGQDHQERAFSRTKKVGAPWLSRSLVSGNARQSSRSFSRTRLRSGGIHRSILAYDRRATARSSRSSLSADERADVQARGPPPTARLAGERPASGCARQAGRVAGLQRDRVPALAAEALHRHPVAGVGTTRLRRNPGREAPRVGRLARAGSVAMIVRFFAVSSQIRNRA